MNFINPLLENLIINNNNNQHIWGADLADMQLLSKFNKGIKDILCAIDLFS